MDLGGIGKYVTAFLIDKLPEYDGGRDRGPQQLECLIDDKVNL